MNKRDRKAGWKHKRGFTTGTQLRENVYTGIRVIKVENGMWKSNGWYLTWKQVRWCETRVAVCLHSGIEVVQGNQPMFENVVLCNLPALREGRYW